MKLSISISELQERDFLGWKIIGIEIQKNSFGSDCILCVCKRCLVAQENICLKTLIKNTSYGCRSCSFLKDINMLEILGLKFGYCEVIDNKIYRDK
jgi:hypothetical protein